MNERIGIMTLAFSIISSFLQLINIQAISVLGYLQLLLPLEDSGKNVPEVNQKVTEASTTKGPEITSSSPPSEQPQPSSSYSSKPMYAIVYACVIFIPAWSYGKYLWFWKLFAQKHANYLELNAIVLEKNFKFSKVWLRNWSDQFDW